jgi:hypothetical protein
MLSSSASGSADAIRAALGVPCLATIISFLKRAKWSEEIEE